MSHSSARAVSISTNQSKTIGLIGTSSLQDDYFIGDALEAGKSLANRFHHFVVGGTLGAPFDILYAILKTATTRPKITVVIPYEYRLPIAYYRTFSHLEVVRFGLSMEERRKRLVELCDILVVCNGGLGTADEITHALTLGKPVVAIKDSGGCSFFLKNQVSPTEVGEFILSGKV